jgi:cytochrome P450
MTRRQLDVNFFTPDVIANPYPLYEQVRATGEIVWNDLLQAWMVVGWDLAAEILSDDKQYQTANGDPEFIFWFDAPNMITVDGEYHRRLRNAVAPMFTRTAVARWEKRVAEVVDEMLEPLANGASSYDLITDFTMIPTIIVAEMLGVAPERHADLRRWSHEIVSNLAYGSESGDHVAIMKRAAREVNDYLREEIERHRRDTPDDLLTAMLQLEGEEKMTAEEIRSTAVLLLLAGYDTTAKTMSNSLIALAMNPEQRAVVVEDLSLVPGAIEECMRWNGPVQFNLRVVRDAVALADTRVAAGDTIYVFYAAASRDPGRWPDPGRFDVRREYKANLSFGRGAHLCLGAPLARLEVKVALERLLTIAPDYQLRDIDLGNAFFVRGPERGVISLSAPG